MHRGNFLRGGEGETEERSARLSFVVVVVVLDVVVSFTCHQPLCVCV